MDGALTVWLGGWLLVASAAGGAAEERPQIRKGSRSLREGVARPVVGT